MRMKWTRDFISQKNQKKIEATDCDAIAYLAPFTPYNPKACHAFTL
jgi:hypothetical protein